MAVINVPKTPKRAYNPGRLPSGLLRAQIQHLEAAVAGDAQPQTRSRRSKPRTEGEAAEYIAELTARLHPLPGAMPAPPDPSTEPGEPAGPIEIVRRRAATSRARGGAAKPRVEAARPGSRKKPAPRPARKAASTKRSGRG